MVTSGNGLDWMEKTPLSTGEKWVRIPLGTQHILLTLGWDERFISASTWGSSPSSRTRKGNQPVRSGLVVLWEWFRTTLTIVSVWNMGGGTNGWNRLPIYWPEAHQAERPAVNRKGVGSSPTWSAKSPKFVYLYGDYRKDRTKSNRIAIVEDYQYSRQKAPNEMIHTLDSLFSGIVQW